MANHWNDYNRPLDPGSDFLLPEGLDEQRRVKLDWEIYKYRDDEPVTKKNCPAWIFQCYRLNRNTRWKVPSPKPEPDPDRYKRLSPEEQSEKAEESENQSEPPGKSVKLAIDGMKYFSTGVNLANGSSLNSFLKFKV